MGGSCRPGPIEPEKSSLWMDLLSLDSVVTCNCLPFSWPSNCSSWSDKAPVSPKRILEVDLSYLPKCTLAQQILKNQGLFLSGVLLHFMCAAADLGLL